MMNKHNIKGNLVQLLNILIEGCKIISVGEAISFCYTSRKKDRFNSLWQSHVFLFVLRIDFLTLINELISFCLRTSNHSSVGEFDKWNNLHFFRINLLRNRMWNDHLNELLVLKWMSMSAGWISWSRGEK